MREVCYCGRVGEVEERRLVTDGDGREALECPRCGHLDHLSWLPDHARERTLARKRRPADGRKAPAA
jgi:hypothetical protein